MLQRCLELIFPAGLGEGTANGLYYRAALALLTALVAGLLLMPRWTVLVRKLRWIEPGHDFRGLTPQSKSSVPIMGGVVILFAFGLGTLAWCDLSNRYVQTTLLFSFAYAAIGFADDVLKVRPGRRGQGLSETQKYALIGAVSLGLGLLVACTSWVPLPGDVGRTILFPFPWGGAWAWAPGCIAFILLFACFLPNAVNITDGMDGLAIGPAMLLTVFLMVLATVAGDDVLAARYHVPALPGQSEQVVLLATVLGASVGFLWFNAPPATIFMGDTGSMALGGLFAVAAVLLRQELLVLIAGGLFVIEGLSTTIQSYVGIALLGRRLFFRAPLHHTWHFRGLGESKIVIRLWILAGLFLSAALVLLQSRVS